MQQVLDNKGSVGIDRDICLQWQSKSIKESEGDILQNHEVLRSSLTAFRIKAVNSNKEKQTQRRESSAFSSEIRKQPRTEKEESLGACTVKYETD